jgi:hypothetical protein
MKACIITLILLMSAHNAFAVTYTVPVSADLSEYATFELENFQFTDNHNSVSVKYKIPKTLTGVEQIVEFYGVVNPSAASNFLFGKNGTIECPTVAKEEKLVCKVEYKNLLSNESQAISIISKTTSNRKDFLGRIQVMRSFSSDPVGFLHY